MSIKNFLVDDTVPENKDVRKIMYQALYYDFFDITRYRRGYFTPLLWCITKVVLDKESSVVWILLVDGD